MTVQEYNDQLKAEINESQESGELTENLHVLFYKLIARQVEKRLTKKYENLSLPLIIEYSVNAHKTCVHSVSKFNLNKRGKENTYIYFVTVIRSSFAGTEAKRYHRKNHKNDTRPI